MKQFSVHAAKTQLSKLIDAALAGEEVVIAKGSKPVVRLVPIPAVGVPASACSRGRSRTVPDFFEPHVRPEDLNLWEGG